MCCCMKRGSSWMANVLRKFLVARHRLLRASRLTRDRAGVFGQRVAWPFVIGEYPELEIYILRFLNVSTDAFLLKI